MDPGGLRLHAGLGLIYGFYAIDDPDDDDALRALANAARLKNQIFSGMLRWKTGPYWIGSRVLERKARIRHRENRDQRKPDHSLGSLQLQLFAGDGRRASSGSPGSSTTASGFSAAFPGSCRGSAGSDAASGSARSRAAAPAGSNDRHDRLRSRKCPHHEHRESASGRGGAAAPGKSRARRSS